MLRCVERIGGSRRSHNDAEESPNSYGQQAG